jgi:hypothetical protein
MRINCIILDTSYGEIKLEEKTEMKAIRRAAELAALVTLYLALLGCGLNVGVGINFHFQGGKSMEAKAKHFQSPKEAVTLTIELMADENWSELASYYDLNGSSVKPGELRDGSYFNCEDDPSVPMHPALRHSCKRPFSPSFSYRYFESVPDGVRVHLGISIDQGGGMVQEGRDSFLLSKSKEGYRLRPDDIMVKESTDLPMQVESNDALKLKLDDTEE